MMPPAGQNGSRRLLVAGGSAGIGRALADAAWDAGWRVAVVARRADAVADVVRGRDRGVARGFVADLADDGAAHSTVGGACELWGGLDAVVYCAAVTHLGAVERTTSIDWVRLLRSNLIGAALLAGASLPALAESNGRFAALSSDSVAAPLAGLLAYSASKAGLDHLLTALPLEAASVPITRIVIGPTLTGLAGGFDPDLLAYYFEEWAASGWFDGVVPREPERVAAEIVGRWLAAPIGDLPPILDLSYLARP